jgi:hypothetical protein
VETVTQKPLSNVTAKSSFPPASQSRFSTNFSLPRKSSVLRLYGLRQDDAAIMLDKLTRSLIIIN